MATGFKVYSGNKNFKVCTGGDTFVVDRVTEPPSASREEVVTYFREMSEPSISINYGAKTVTCTFTPVSEYIARGMVKSRMIQFRVVRNRAGTTHHKILPRFRNKIHKRHDYNHVKENFPYQFYWDKYSQGTYAADITMLADKVVHNPQVTVEELTSGRIVRDITQVFNIKYAHGNNYHQSVEFIAGLNGDAMWAQFYFGLVYFDSASIPTYYKMREYDIDKYWP